MKQNEIFNANLQKTPCGPIYAQKMNTLAIEQFFERHKSQKSFFQLKKMKRMPRLERHLFSI